MNFDEFVSRLVAQDNLPFSVSFDGEALEGSYPVKAGNLTIPCVNELLIQEAWFFEKLSEITGAKRKEIRPLILALSSKLQEAMGLDSIAEGRAVLFNPSEELTNDPNYQKFVVEYEDEIIEVFQMLRDLASDFAIRLNQITFFLKSRLGDDWTMARVAKLRKSQLEAIEKLIYKEMNGGSEPEEAETEDTEEGEPEEVKKEQTGDPSTGN